MKCQGTTHEIIHTYSVDHITPGSLHVKCQEIIHEIIPTYSVDHFTPGSLHVKRQETMFNLNEFYLLLSHNKMKQKFQNSI